MGNPSSPVCVCAAGPIIRAGHHQKEKRSMDHFAGLDVSVKETSICVVDDAGKIINYRPFRSYRLRWRKCH